MSQELSRELISLFNLKKAKMTEDKRLALLAEEAQKEIRLLISMFKDGIEDVAVMIADDEWIKWDSQGQRLYYKHKGEAIHIDAASREIKIRVRPYLIQLVRAAREFYET